MKCRSCDREIPKNRNTRGECPSCVQRADKNGRCTCGRPIRRTPGHGSRVRECICGRVPPGPRQAEVLIERRSRLTAFDAPKVKDILEQYRKAMIDQPASVVDALREQLGHEFWKGKK